MGSTSPQHAVASVDGLREEVTSRYRASQHRGYYLSHTRQMALSCERKGNVDSPEEISDGSLTGPVFKDCLLNENHTKTLSPGGFC